MVMTNQMVDTSVGRLHVEVEGEGPPAVLWHSLFVDSGSWSRMRPLLRDQRRLIVVDGPGHGRSSTPPALFDLDGCALAAAEVLDALGVAEPVDWVGNAWGGHVGLTLAAKFASRCRSVTTIATPVHGLTPRERLKIVPTVWAYRFLGAVPPIANGVVRALLGSHFMRSRPDDTAAVVASFRNAPRSGMHRAMTCVMLNRTDLDPLLPTITTPTLMIVPTRTRCCLPLRSMRQYAKCRVLQRWKSRPRVMWRRSSRMPSSWRTPSPRSGGIRAAMSLTRSPLA